MQENLIKNVKETIDIARRIVAAQKNDEESFCTRHRQADAPIKESMTKICSCGITFEVPNEVAKYVDKCNKCVDKATYLQAKERTNALYKERLAKWISMCPKVFHNTRKDKLPMPQMLDKVCAWEYNETGLLLHGPTGTGKSRCAWELAKKMFMQGKTIAALSPMSGIEYGAQFGAGAAVAAEWVKQFVKAQILVCDDVWKSRNTESWEAALFAIINTRAEKCLPVIFTCNDTGDTLSKRASQDRSEPLIRRLKEFTTSISFMGGTK